MDLAFDSGQWEGIHLLCAKRPDNQTCPGVHALDASGCSSGVKAVGV
jgi:hypothetical protein